MTVITGNYLHKNFLNIKHNVVLNPISDSIPVEKLFKLYILTVSYVKNKELKIIYYSAGNHFVVRKSSLSIFQLEKVSIGHGCPRQMPFRKRVYM